MTWRPHSVDAARSLRSNFWTYMGDLYVNNNRIDDKLYCKLCFEAEMTKEHGMLSKVYSLGENTSSGNFLGHAKAAHKESTVFLKEQSSKLTNWIQTVPKGRPATSQFDVNRDLLLWLCQDLLQFELIKKEGFRARIKRICAQIWLEPPQCLIQLSETSL